MEKAFRNWREGAVHLNFPNGNHISTTWARSSYSDNHDTEYPDINTPPKYATDRIKPIVESDTCEIMFDCSDALEKRLLKQFNDGDSQPIGYLSVQNWVNIVNRLANEKKT